MTKRKAYAATVKAKLALEAVKGIQPLEPPPETRLTHLKKVLIYSHEANRCCCEDFTAWIIPEASRPACGKNEGSQAGSAVVHSPLHFLVGGSSFYDMETFGRSRRDWLPAVVGMGHVPSHDTLNRVFQGIWPKAFGDFLIKITQRLRQEIAGDNVAIDGKALTGFARGMSRLIACSMHGP